MKRILVSLALLIIAVSAPAGTYAISTAADSGPGSLRQGILDANSGACSAPCSIQYGSTSGVLTVAPLTPLPDIIASRVSIVPGVPYQAWTLEISGKNLTSGSGLHFRGSNSGVSGVIINGFPGSGVVIEDAANVTIGGCVIGLDPTGTRAVPNGANGVTIVHGNNIYLDSDTIGGNKGNGVYAVGATDVIFGLDVIGKQYLPRGSGDAVLPNGGSGIVLVDVTRAQMLNTTIANNALAGIVIAGNTTGARLESIDLPSVIYANGLLAIDIGFDGVTDPRPNVTLAEISNGYMRVKGEVQSTPNTTVTVNIFGSDVVGPFGTADAKKALAATNVKSDANGLATFEIRFLMQTDLSGQWISASATTVNGSQELSTPIHAVVNNQNFTVVNSEDGGAGSLRQAILDANASPCASDFPCLINFSSDVHVISPVSPLPAIARSGIVIDGQNTVEINGSRSPSGPGLTIAAVSENVFAPGIRRVTVRGFHGDGILIDATHGFQLLNPVLVNNIISGNLGAGVRARGNIPFVHIGTFASGNRMVSNVIRDNASHGIALEGGFFELESNAISANAGSGVYIESAAFAHLERNFITFNGQTGVSTLSTDPIAFKGVIQNSIHSNAGRAIELRDLTQMQSPPEITSATYDPATQTGTITGTVARSGAPSQWTVVVDFATSTFPEIGSRGSLETPINVNITMQSLANGQYSFRGTTLQQDLRGKRISATATPFEFEGFKGTPQDNVFGQGFVYGTTSEVSKAVPVVTVGCTAGAPQLASATATGTSVTFNWTAVPGATGYNVWLRSSSAPPNIIGRSLGSAATITVAPGTYEWFVEATFNGCPPMKSEAAALDVGGGRHRSSGR